MRSPQKGSHFEVSLEAWEKRQARTKPRRIDGSFRLGFPCSKGTRSERFRRAERWLNLRRHKTMDELSGESQVGMNFTVTCCFLERKARKEMGTRSVWAHRPATPLNPDSSTGVRGVFPNGSLGKPTKEGCFSSIKFHGCFPPPPPPPAAQVSPRCHSKVGEEFATVGCCARQP